MATEEEKQNEIDKIPVKVYLYQLSEVLGKEILMNIAKTKEFGGKEYPIITAEDVFNRFNPFSCELCDLHSSKTPCGVAMKRWKKVAKLNDAKSKNASEDLFNRELLPCFNRLAGSSYFQKRMTYFFNNSSRFAQFFYVLQMESAWREGGCDAFLKPKTSSLDRKVLLPDWQI